jgi:hypothetical protein
MDAAICDGSVQTLTPSELVRPDTRRSFHFCPYDGYECKLHAIDRVGNKITHDGFCGETLVFARQLA